MQKPIKVFRRRPQLRKVTPRETKPRTRARRVQQPYALAAHIASSECVRRISFSISSPWPLLRDTQLDHCRTQIKKVSNSNRASASLSDSLTARIQKGGGRRTRPHVCPHKMCAEEDQHACHLRLPFAGPCRVSTPLRRGGNGEEVRTCGVCAMDQILLQRNRDEHTPARSSAERIPSHLSVACAEACDIVPPFRCFSLMIL